VIRVHGVAGQSFGAFLPLGVDVRLAGQANDYVAKGLAGGTVMVAPEPEFLGQPELAHVAGNTCLYGATGGRLHLVGRAGMRFAIRNSGAVAVVEGIGPHGCQYMTGGTVAVLGPVGANFGAGMTGGRAYLYDPEGREVGALNGASVGAVRLSTALDQRAEGEERLAELQLLLERHAAAGSPKAGELLQLDGLADAVWLVEPIAELLTTQVQQPESRPEPIRSALHAGRHVLRPVIAG
jgi:glutamate synthase domain-containing protein 3